MDQLAVALGWMVKILPRHFAQNPDGRRLRCSFDPLGISVHEFLAARQNSQKLSRSEALLGKRQAMPTIAMGIVISIPSDRLILSRLGTSMVPFIDSLISQANAREGHIKKIVRPDANNDLSCTRNTGAETESRVEQALYNPSARDPKTRSSS